MTDVPAPTVEPTAEQVAEWVGDARGCTRYRGAPSYSDIFKALDLVEAAVPALAAALSSARADTEHANKIALDMIAERDALKLAIGRARDVCRAASGDGNHIGGVSVVVVPRVLAALAAQPTVTSGPT